jgi:ParB-like chromosome segregation protein Spo0J
MAAISKAMASMMAQGATTDDGAEAPDVVPVSALSLTGSPRSSGIDREHVLRLAQVLDSLPPIVVHHPTMHIVDGYHRVAAAMREKRDSISARFVDGPAESILVMAIKANTAHGLPLSLADRRSAAGRIIGTFPQWSNRAIAEVTGLSATTVGEIRSAHENGPNLDARVGKDGRTRHLSSAGGRAVAAELIRARPQASLREIAAEAGISPNTVRDVRARLLAGRDHTPENQRRCGRNSIAADVTLNVPTADVTSVLHVLSRDPALRMNSDGRNLLRWLHSHAVGPETVSILQPAPAHCVNHLIELARRCAANWAKVASDLEDVRRTCSAS